MSLAYTGTRELLKELELSTNEELANTILNPKSYKQTWESVRRHVGHDFHDLSFLHNTLCFMLNRGGELTREGMLVLMDELQDAYGYVEQCIIPALQELGLVAYAPNNVILFTDRGYKVQPQPRFVEMSVKEE